MPIIGQDPVESVRLPKAWWVPAEQAEVIDRLRLHGIAFEAIRKPRVLTLDRVRLLDPVVQQAQDGRLPLKAGFVHETVTETLPAGTIRVPSDQALGLLAAALLEPEAPDSFAAWGLFPEMLARFSRAEDFVEAALADALLARDDDVRAKFERKLADDSDFAADADARVSWLMGRLPKQEPRRFVYLIYREP